MGATGESKRVRLTTVVRAVGTTLNPFDASVATILPSQTLPLGSNNGTGRPFFRRRNLPPRLDLRGNCPALARCHEVFVTHREGRASIRSGHKMTLGQAFWILMLIWFVFGLVWHFGLTPAPWGLAVNSVLLFVLFGLLGWQTFGTPFRRS